MKCTMDCWSEGRNYVNPFEYDPADVLSWYKSSTGGKEMYPFEDRRRDLGLIPHPDYWYPYSYEDGPFECVCDEEQGFVYDEEADDGSCFNCATIKPDPNHANLCAKCHFDEEWVCDICQDDNFNPSPNGDWCVPGIKHCEVSIYEQPYDAFGELTLLKDEDNNWWICPECEPGFYFEFEAPSGVQAQCLPCKVVGCLSCDPATQRCDECDDDLIPSYKGDLCISPIEFCETDPINYDHNGDVWKCPECEFGYF